MKLYRKILTVNRTEPNFDRACDAAYHQALLHFGIDDYGNSDKKEIDFVRSTDSIKIRFLGYEHTGGMGGQESSYSFTAWIERYKEESDEEE